MTKTRRTQTGGWDWPWTKKTTEQSGDLSTDPQQKTIVEQIQDGAQQIQNRAETLIKGEPVNQVGGSRRRRRRCTKKHRHSSACKRKSKGRKSYRKRR